MNEQIEKMAMAICKSRLEGVGFNRCFRCFVNDACLYQDIAKHLFNEGYRKQSEKGLILSVDGITGYFPKEFIADAISAYIKTKDTPPERCVACGDIIPEGKQVCVACERGKKYGYKFKAQRRKR